MTDASKILKGDVNKTTVIYNEETIENPSLDAKLITDMKSIQPYSTRNEYIYAMKEDLADWFNSMYSTTLTAENFTDQLKNGVLICRHANCVMKEGAAKAFKFNVSDLNAVGIVNIPNLIKTSAATGVALSSAKQFCTPSGKSQFAGEFLLYNADPKTQLYRAYDNITNFIKWCRFVVKVRECLMFETEDLILCKNEKNFILCLLEVARFGSRFGIKVPTIIQLEQEIEAEIAMESSRILEEKKLMEEEKKNGDNLSTPLTVPIEIKTDLIQPVNNEHCSSMNIVIDKKIENLNAPIDNLNERNHNVDTPFDILGTQIDIEETPIDIVDTQKDIVYKPIDIVDKPIDIVDKPIDIVDKPIDIVCEPSDNVNVPLEIVDERIEKEEEELIYVINKSTEIVDKPIIENSDKSGVVSESVDLRDSQELLNDSLNKSEDSFMEDFVPINENLSSCAVPSEKSDSQMNWSQSSSNKIEDNCKIRTSVNDQDTDSNDDLSYINDSLEYNQHENDIDQEINKYDNDNNNNSKTTDHNNSSYLNVDVSHRPDRSEINSVNNTITAVTLLNTNLNNQNGSSVEITSSLTSFSSLSSSEATSSNSNANTNTNKELASNSSTTSPSSTASSSPCKFQLSSSSNTSLKNSQTCKDKPSLASINIDCNFDFITNPGNFSMSSPVYLSSPSSFESTPTSNTDPASAKEEIEQELTKEINELNNSTMPIELNKSLSLKEMTPQVVVNKRSAIPVYQTPSYMQRIVPELNSKYSQLKTARNLFSSQESSKLSTANTSLTEERPESVETRQLSRPSLPNQVASQQTKDLHGQVCSIADKCTCEKQFLVDKIGEGKYKIGNTKNVVFIRILRNHIMVRVGGGWDTLENYLNKHDPCRCGPEHAFSKKFNHSHHHNHNHNHNHNTISDSQNNSFDQSSSCHNSSKNIILTPLKSSNQSNSASPSISIANSNTSNLGQHHRFTPNKPGVDFTNAHLIIERNNQGRHQVGKVILKSTSSQLIEDPRKTANTTLNDTCELHSDEMTGIRNLSICSSNNTSFNQSQVGAMKHNHNQAAIATKYTPLVHNYNNISINNSLPSSASVQNSILAINNTNIQSKTLTYQANKTNNKISSDSSNLPQKSESLLRNKMKKLINKLPTSSNHTNTNTNTNTNINSSTNTNTKVSYNTNSEGVSMPPAVSSVRSKHRMVEPTTNPLYDPPSVSGTNNSNNNSFYNNGLFNNSFSKASAGLLKFTRPSNHAEPSSTGYSSFYEDSDFLDSSTSPVSVYTATKLPPRLLRKYQKRAHTEALHIARDTEDLSSTTTTTTATTTTTTTTSNNEIKELKIDCDVNNDTKSSKDNDTTSETGSGSGPFSGSGMGSPVSRTETTADSNIMMDSIKTETIETISTHSIDNRTENNPLYTDEEAKAIQEFEHQFDRIDTDRIDTDKIETISIHSIENKKEIIKPNADQETKKEIQDFEEGQLDEIETIEVIETIETIASPTIEEASPKIEIIQSFTDDEGIQAFESQFNTTESDTEFPPPPEIEFPSVISEKEIKEDELVGTKEINDLGLVDFSAIENNLENLNLPSASKSPVTIINQISPKPVARTKKKYSKKSVTTDLSRYILSANFRKVSDSDSLEGDSIEEKDDVPLCLLPNADQNTSYLFKPLAHPIESSYTTQQQQHQESQITENENSYDNQFMQKMIADLNDSLELINSRIEEIQSKDTEISRMINLDHTELNREEDNLVAMIKPAKSDLKSHLRDELFMKPVKQQQQQHQKQEPKPQTSNRAKWDKTQDEFLLSKNRAQWDKTRQEVDLMYFNFSMKTAQRVAQRNKQISDNARRTSNQSKIRSTSSKSNECNTPQGTPKKTRNLNLAKEKLYQMKLNLDTISTSQTSAVSDVTNSRVSNVTSNPAANVNGQTIQRSTPRKVKKRSGERSFTTGLFGEQSRDKSSESSTYRRPQLNQMPLRSRSPFHTTNESPRSSHKSNPPSARSINSSSLHNISHILNESGDQSPGRARTDSYASTNSNCTFSSFGQATEYKETKSSELRKKTALMNKIATKTQQFDPIYSRSHPVSAEINSVVSSMGNTSIGSYEQAHAARKRLYAKKNEKNTMFDPNLSTCSNNSSISSGTTNSSVPTSSSVTSTPRNQRQSRSVKPVNYIQNNIKACSNGQHTRNTHVKPQVRSKSNCEMTYKLERTNSEQDLIELLNNCDAPKGDLNQYKIMLSETKLLDQHITMLKSKSKKQENQMEQACSAMDKYFQSDSAKLNFDDLEDDEMEMYSDKENSFIQSRLNVPRNGVSDSSSSSSWTKHPRSLSKHVIPEN